MPKKKVESKKTDSKEQLIEEVTKEMLSQLDIPGSVMVTPGEADVYLVNVETEESGLLIGYHGETLSAFQLLLGQIVTKRANEWVRVVVEVGDYRAKREEQLQQMAQSYAEQVIATGQPIALPSLPPIERRIIHMALQENTEVETFSEGEGNMRRLIIKLRSSSKE